VFDKNEETREASLRRFDVSKVRSVLGVSERKAVELLKLLEEALFTNEIRYIAIPARFIFAEDLTAPEFVSLVAHLDSHGIEWNTRSRDGGIGRKLLKAIYGITHPSSTSLINKGYLRDLALDTARGCYRLSCVTKKVFERISYDFRQFFRRVVKVAKCMTLNNIQPSFGGNINMPSATASALKVEAHNFEIPDELSELVEVISADLTHHQDDFASAVRFTAAKLISFYRRFGHVRQELVDRTLRFAAEPNYYGYTEQTNEF
jgi:hypothetical protein